jgi:hypothetical protein
MAIVNSWIEKRLDEKVLGHRRKNVIDLLELNLYIG